MNECWGQFMDWANDNGVGMDHEEDWGPWWECWQAGIQAYKDQQ